MKRLASLIQATALAGALVLPVCAAHAQSTTYYGMYLVPISPLNGQYHTGDTIQFASLIDIGPGDGTITIALGAAVTYDGNVFDTNNISGQPDTSAYPPKPSIHLWDLIPPNAYSQTSEGAATFQLTSCHTKQTLQPGNKTTTIPAGTYTIGTYSFPILATAPLTSTTISLPSAVGQVGPTSAMDFINTLDILGTNHSVLSFPSGNGKYSALTYNIVPNLAIYYGFLNRQGISPNAPGQEITAEFRPKNGGTAFTRSTPLASNSYSFEVAAQPYIIHITCNKYLAVDVDTDQGTVTPDGLQLPPITLLAGDANNDNTVDIADFSIMTAAYGSDKSDPTSGYDAQADFDGNGLVDIGDFALVVSNYGVTGDL